MAKNPDRSEYKNVMPVPGHKPIIISDPDDPLPKWAKKWGEERKAKMLTAAQPREVKREVKRRLATTERHRQIINKMEREKFITPAKAKALRQELKAQL